MSAKDINAHTATKTKAARQLTSPASSVPKGTPSVFASVWPRTMTATAWFSRPFSAMALAAMVAVPKNAPLGMPEMKRATVSVAASGASAAIALPAQHSSMKAMSRRFGSIRWPNTRMSVPKHTPTAYADMNPPASGTVTPTPAAMFVMIPMTRNSANPKANEPVASAISPFFIDDSLYERKRTRASIRPTLGDSHCVQLSGTPITQ